VSDASFWDSVSPYIGAGLFLLSPCLFLIGFWLSDRRMRRRGRAVLQRCPAACVYSLAVIAVVLALAQVPPSMQFSSDSADIVAASYMFGLGWYAMVIVATICLIIALITALALLVRQGLTNRSS
jgi:hypothetical protein